MTTDFARPSDRAPAGTSLAAKLVNMWASPGDVFDEVVAAPPRTLNWLVPMVLACLISLLVLGVFTNKEQATTVTAGKTTAAQEGTLVTSWHVTAVLASCAAVVLGTLWSAFVLWVMGRVLLKSRFAFIKALEVVSLTGMIMALGLVVTALLILASGDVTTRPALSISLRQLESGDPLRVALDAVNVFHIWMTVVLAVGLRKLSKGSFSEAAFWVFSYWILTRL